MISTCTWNGAGWKDTYYGAEVLSITNGDIFAAPVDTLADLDTTSGEKLIVAFGMGISGVDQGQSAAEAFGGVALDGSQQLVLENRTSDPVAPVTGRIWIRTDL